MKRHPKVPLPEDRPTLRVPEVADLLDISKSTAYAAVNAGVSTNFNKRGGVGARAGFTLGW